MGYRSRRGDNIFVFRGAYSRRGGNPPVNTVFQRSRAVHSGRQLGELPPGIQLRGEGDRCIETIKFTCDNGKYSFNSFIEVDMEAVVKAPEQLAEQFAQSKFSRLKSYIDERAEIQNNGGTPS